MEYLRFMGKGRHPLVQDACDEAAEYLYPAFKKYSVSLQHLCSDSNFMIQLIHMQNEFNLKEINKETEFIENQIILGRYYAITEIINDTSYGIIYKHDRLDINKMSKKVHEILFESKKKLIDLFINRNYSAGYIHIGKYYQAKEFIDIIDLFYNLKKGDINVNFR